MIRHPYGPDELDRTDPELDGVAEQLQDYASGQRSSPPVDLAARIHAAVDAEPDPAIGWWARVTGSMSGWGMVARGLTAAAVVTAAVAVAFAVGGLADLVRGPINPGTTPSPSVVVSPSPSPSPTISPTRSPTPSPSPSPVPSVSTSPQQTPAATPTDDDGGVESPEPSGSDNSGPGGGGGDNSGPGGGGGSGSGG
jgi:hypothetical protein